MMLGGYEASYQENATFEDSLFWLSGLSAVKAFAILKAMGVPILEWSPPNMFMYPGLPDAIVSDINDALNMGWKVMVPATDGGLPVFPYIMYDGKTGSAGYMIASSAGGLATLVTAIGHELDFAPFLDLFSQPFWEEMRLIPEVLAPVSPYVVAMGNGFPLVLKMTAEFGPAGPNASRAIVNNVAWIDTNANDYLAGRWPLYALQAGEYILKFNGLNLFTLNVWGVYINADATGKYMGISTADGVDTISSPIDVSYNIVGTSIVNVSSFALKVYSGDSVIREIPQNPMTQSGTMNWDGKDNNGQIVAPGEYAIVFEATGAGGTTRSKVQKVTVFKLEIIEVNTPSDTGQTANPVGDNSFVAPADQIEAKARILGAPALENQISWRVVPIGPQTGQANPNTASNTNTLRFNASSLQQTTGSRQANQPLRYEVTASVTGGGVTIEDRVEPLAPIEQDTRDIIRQEYIDFGIVYQPMRIEIDAPDPLISNNDSYNDGNYGLMINGVLPQLKRDFVAQLNAILAAPDVQLIPSCPCVPTDRRCRDASPAQCRIAPMTPIIQAGTDGSTSEPRRPQNERRVIIFHSTPSGNNVYCDPATGQTSTTDAISNFICAGSSGMSETNANTISYPAYGVNDFYVSSGYRNPQKNSDPSVGSNSLTSMHPRGRALDIRIINFDIPELTSTNDNCILEMAGDRAVGGGNSFIERGTGYLPCDDSLADHLHIQRP